MLKLKRDGKYIVLILFIALFYIYKAGEIPAGLFCDEAEIGNTAYKLVTGNFSTSFVAPFFYRHYANYVLGILPVLAVSPFIMAASLSEFSVRLSSAVYSLVSLLIIFLTLHELKVKKMIPILLLAFTPLFFHISRISFGHAPSFMLVSLGIYFFIKAKNNRRLLLLIMSAVAFALSTYGYMGYILGTPVVLICLLVPEFIFSKDKRKKAKELLILIMLLLFSILPILWQLKFNPAFSYRFKEKYGSEQPDLKRKIFTILRNYPKYYSYDYLFEKGENGLPGAFISRHTVTGNGIFLKVFLPVLILAIFNLVFLKDKKKVEFLPFFLIFLLAPLPDLLTTKDNLPPYSLSIYFGLISIPFITAYAFTIFKHLSKFSNLKRVLKLFEILILAVILFEVFFFLKNYYRYPLYSADYWGWQYGPKEIIRYFVSQKESYDELYMTGYFNQPDALLAFYNYNQKCPNCLIGSPFYSTDYRKKQLFAVRVEELKDLKLKYVRKKVIKLPDGKDAYYIIEPVKP